MGTRRAPPAPQRLGAPPSVSQPAIVRTAGVFPPLAPIIGPNLPPFIPPVIIPPVLPPTVCDPETDPECTNEPPTEPPSELSEPGPLPLMMLALMAIVVVARRSQTSAL
ncbi:MAG: hypothetical protein AAF224_05690 [Pseudomonadota bacterium]